MSKLKDIPFGSEIPTFDNGGYITLSSGLKGPSGSAIIETCSGLAFFIGEACYASFATCAGDACWADNANSACCAGYACHAGNATFAGNATCADNASYATCAGFACCAGNACYADNATCAGFACCAGNASYADNASLASDAVYLSYCTSHLSPSYCNSLSAYLLV